MMLVKGALLAGAATLAAVAGDATAMAIESLAELNAFLENATDPAVGFLTEANYQTVHDVLSDKVRPVFRFKHTSELEEAVSDGTLVAGLISGVPDTEKFHTFSSTLVSPRGMFVSEMYIDAIDAAIVRVIKKGIPQKIAHENPPFEMVSVFNCKGAPDMFPFPNLTFTKGTLTIGALGPHNWGVDGNYQSPYPHTGFWPAYYEAIQEEFNAHYGVSFNRQWFNTSTSLMNALQHGEIDATEPYMTIDSFHNGKGRKSLFDVSCITAGYDSTFFTKKSAPEVEIKILKDNELSEGAIVGIVAISVAAAIAAVAIVFMIRREKSGKPLFQPLGTPGARHDSHGSKKSHELVGL